MLDLDLRIECPSPVGLIQVYKSGFGFVHGRTSLVTRLGRSEWQVLRTW